MALNVTFYEPTLGLTTFFTRARLVGRAKRNSETGEITGLKFACASSNKREVYGTNTGCEENAGGILTLDVDGRKINLMGEVEFTAGGIENEASPNTDGSMAITGKAVLDEAEVKLRAGNGLRLDDLRSCTGFVG